MDKVDILLVDDEALLRQGLRSLLEKESFIRTIYEAGDAADFHFHLSTYNIDIILLDIRLRDTSGIELLDSLKMHEQRPRIIAVTGMEGVELMINLLKAGVDGIVYKLNGYDEIRKTIRSIIASGNYFPENVLRIIQSNVTRWGDIPTVNLSAQEVELLKAIAAGSVTKEIAVALKMAEATAETYRIRLIKKVGASNTAALLAYAFRNGIL
jgi:DNA-binding NarL/FixJ family response regulator